MSQLIEIRLTQSRFGIEEESGRVVTPESLDLFEAMSTARAIRRFAPTPISDEVINGLVQAAAYAPSGGNIQQWRIVIITDPAQKAALGPLWRSSWASFLETLPDPGESASDLHQRQIPRATELADNIEAVPAIAIFCFHWRSIGYTDADLDRPSVVGGASIYPAVQNFLLACRAHGLGAVLTTTLCLVEREVAQLLDLPRGVGIHAAVPFGYPDNASHGPLRRRPPSELAFRDRWNNPHITT